MSHGTEFSGPFEKAIYEVTNVTEKTVRPSLARRLAAAAVMTTTLLQPMGELLAAVSPQVDIMEIACAQESTLTTVFEEQGSVARGSTTSLATTLTPASARASWPRTSRRRSQD